MVNHKLNTHHSLRVTFVSTIVPGWGLFRLFLWSLRKSLVLIRFLTTISANLGLKQKETKTQIYIKIYTRNTIFAVTRWERDFRHYHSFFLVLKHRKSVHFGNVIRSCVLAVNVDKLLYIINVKFISRHNIWLCNSSLLWICTYLNKTNLH